MINKFFNEYGAQKAAWIHEQEVTKDASKDLKVLSKDGDILRNRILRTFLKRDPNTRLMTSYNFDPETFQKYLMIYDAVLPSTITQNDKGDFVLLFKTENQLNAFYEAFSKGIEIKGTTVYFKKVSYRELGEAMSSVAAMFTKRKKEKAKKKKAFIRRLFPRNDDDEINLGGLLLPKHACSIDIKEIFHSDWYQQSLPKFEFDPQPMPNDDDNLYFGHIQSMNRDIWDWYHHSIPCQEYMDAIYQILDKFLMSMIRKALNLPSNRGTELNKMVSIFGSASYGLYINRLSDIDIGVNLNIRENNQKKKLFDQSNNKRAHQSSKKVKFLKMLSNKIRGNNIGIYDKMRKTKKERKQSKIAKARNNSLRGKQSNYKKMKKMELKLKRNYRGKQDILIKEERFNANVPILKLFVRKYKLPLDISISNESNFVSKLIMLYVKFDVRVRAFLCCIKYWIAQRSICEAFKGYLNTFGWIIMGIKFLQNGLEIPILPIMKMDNKNGNVMINKSNLLKHKDKENKDTIAELLSSFFEYFANFDFDKYQISITNNVEYEEKNVDHFEKSVWIILHPMKQHKNVSSSVRKWNAHLMKQQLCIASEKILSSKWSDLTSKISHKMQHKSFDAELECSCLMLRNLRYDVTKKIITRFIARIANPISVVLSSYESGKHVGRAYVAMQTPQIAHSVMAELNGNLLLGRPVIMQFAPMEHLIESDDEDEGEDEDEEDESGNVKLKAVHLGRKIKMIGNERVNKMQKDAETFVQSDENYHEDIIISNDLPMVSTGLLLD